jgi:PrtD family type I secretion system ABC transporter
MGRFLAGECRSAHRRDARFLEQSRSVHELLTRFRPFFAYAALFSLAINLLLLVSPLYMLQVFDRVLTSRSEETLLVLTFATVVALGAMALLDALRARLLAAGGMSLDRALGPRSLEALLSHEARRAATEPAQGLRDAQTLRAFLGGSGVLAIFDAPWLPVFLLVICLFHPLLGAMALGGAVLMIVLAVLNERLARGPLARAHAQGRRATRFIESGARNTEAVTALGMLAHLTARWGQLNDAALTEQVQASAVATRFSALTKLARQLIQVAMLAAGAWLVVDQQVTAGIMIATTILLGRALAPVEMLVASWRPLVEARGAWRRLAKQSDAAQPPAATELPPLRGQIEVERAVFALRKGDPPILRGVSFRVAAGESLGIIGPSASGKSTLARLLAGVWRPASGSVRLDGAEAADWPRERLGPQLGYLPQDVELFPGTVAENIARLGEPVAAEVMRAAERAGAHAMILSLPKGYDTEVGDAGEALSPGQRQRIALARALYSVTGRTPQIVILDEPNSNLDDDGHSALIRAMQRLREEGVTLVLVAHRPSLLGAIDKLLVLREGAVEAFGPRDEILPRVTRVVRPRAAA